MISCVSYWSGFIYHRFCFFHKWPWGNLMYAFKVGATIRNWPKGVSVKKREGGFDNWHGEKPFPVRNGQELWFWRSWGSCSFMRNTEGFGGTGWWKKQNSFKLEVAERGKGSTKWPNNRKVRANELKIYMLSLQFESVSWKKFYFIAAERLKTLWSPCQLE